MKGLNCVNLFLICKYYLKFHEMIVNIYCFTKMYLFYFGDVTVSWIFTQFKLSKDSKEYAEDDCCECYQRFPKEPHAYTCQKPHEVHKYIPVDRIKCQAIYSVPLQSTWDASRRITGAQKYTISNKWYIFGNIESCSVK